MWINWADWCARGWTSYCPWLGSTTSRKCWWDRDTINTIFPQLRYIQFATRVYPLYIYPIFIRTIIFGAQDVLKHDYKVAQAINFKSTYIGSLFKSWVIRLFLRKTSELDLLLILTKTVVVQYGRPPLLLVVLRHADTILIFSVRVMGVYYIRVTQMVKYIIYHIFSYPWRPQ